MKFILSLSIGMLSLSAVATAQIEIPDPNAMPEDTVPTEPGPKPEADSEAEPDISGPLGGETTPSDILTEDLDTPTTPDYSALTPKAERKARLDALFMRLAAETDEDTANLIAEEIWALWLDSGSASVNLVLRRGTAAQKRGDKALARRMFDHVMTLEPDYAEGWSRSGRLAIDEEDLDRALHDVTQALVYEPRHFYALWTLGNVLEQLGRTDQAYEAYLEAQKIYPELSAVKDRVEVLQDSVEGDVL